MMNNTLQNGFMILEYLARDAEECSVKELAEHFELPNSHVCRLLKTLTASGYVEQIPKSRKYRISLKILTLSHARLEKLKLRNIARPYMQQVVGDLKSPVFLTSYFNGYSLITATEFPEGFYGDAGLVTGQIHSVNRSACGKICAAYAPEDVLEELLKDCDWSAATEKSVTDPKAFKKELKQIRKQRYSKMDSELRKGIAAVGAPVFDAAKRVIGAVGTMLPSDDSLWTPELWDKYIATIRRCGESISFAIGYPLE